MKKKYIGYTEWVKRLKITVSVKHRCKEGEKKKSKCISRLSTPTLMSRPFRISWFRVLFLFWFFIRPYSVILISKTRERQFWPFSNAVSNKK